jgi:hypothetical protein
MRFRRETLLSRYASGPAGYPSWPLLRNTDHDLRDCAYQFLRTGVAA